MANFNIKDTPLKTPLVATDKVLIQEVGDLNKHSTLADVKDHVVGDLGWEMVHDNQYTQGVPFSVTTGTRVKLTNNGLGGLTNSSQLPNGVTEMFNVTSNELVPPNSLGDILTYRITMQMTPSTANVVGTVEIQIEDAPVIVTGNTTITFPNTTERTIQLFTSTFTLANYIANNASIYVSSTGGSIDVYDLKVLVERSYVGK